jgi:putative ABC transport system permease protein
MQSLIQDIRYGIRSLANSRRFTVAAVLTLALGIGANTAMFSVIHSVLLAPWPVKDPARVLVVMQRQYNGNQNYFSTADYLDWKDQGGLVAGMGAHVAWQYNLSNPGESPERIVGGKVSYDLFPTLGVAPAKGRLFTRQEDAPNSGHTVLLSNSIWRNRYKSDPAIVGKAVSLDGNPYTVVGVMPEGFTYFGNKDLLWTPLQLERGGGVGASPNIHWLLGFIRLPGGLTLKQAQAQLDSVAAHLHHDNATGDPGFGVDLLTLNDNFTGDVRPALVMLMSCVGFVLLIACANVANLLLVRGAGRRREIAVRTALGASPLRIVRQLLTESILLALAGGALGIGLGFVTLRVFLALHPPAVPRMDGVHIDPVVLACALLASLLVGILFGLLPAVNTARSNVNEGLRERTGSPSRRFAVQRALLIIVENALACILLTGTGLALSGLWSIRGVDLGFIPDNVLTFRVAVPATLVGQQVTEFYRQILNHVRAIPGVDSAVIARNLPMSGGDPSMPIAIDGKNPAPVQGEIITRYRAVGDGYFRTLQVPILQGRAFDTGDTADSPFVAIVSRSLANKYWPNENPIGKRLKPSFNGSSWCTVVGVAADVRHWAADVDFEPTAYYPYTQIPDTIRPLLEASMSVAVRSTLPQSSLLVSLRAAVAGVSTTTPIYDVASMPDMVADSGSLRRFDLSLLEVFSVLALLLAAVGVYGVTAYSVAQRTREIGVRMALGALRSDVLRFILGQSARLALAGVLVGVPAAFLLRKLMASLLYGIGENNPLVLIAVPTVMMLVVLIACYAPAHRATRIDPVLALREE